MKGACLGLAMTNVVKDPFKKCIVGWSEGFIFASMLKGSFSERFVGWLCPPPFKGTASGFHSLDGCSGSIGERGRAKIGRKRATHYS